MTTAADPGAEVCIINIGPKERRKRMISGVVSIAIGVVAAFALYRFSMNAYWRLLLFLPFASGATGYFQARDKT
jgi:hypothetical protein